MKKITLVFTLLLTVTFMSAQDIDWQQGAIGSLANRTIEVGETVKWVWGNGSSHDIASTDPDAPADFGAPLTGQQGFVYEYTFNTAGVIDYFCSPHMNSMSGTITVEEVLSTEDKFVLNLTAYPNPVTDKFILESLVPVERYAVYNVLGTKLMDNAGNGNITQIDLSSFASGIYLIKVSTGEVSTTMKLIKK